MTVWSRELLASHRPSGEGARETTGALWPAKTRVRRPVSRSKIATPASVPTATVGRGWPGPGGTNVHDHQCRSRLGSIAIGTGWRPSAWTASSRGGLGGLRLVLSVHPW